MRALYIFVDSERPDQYLNSLVHCVVKEDVRRIVFMHIRGFGAVAGAHRIDGVSARVMGSVHSLLAALSLKAEYLLPSGHSRGETFSFEREYTLERAREIKAYYSRCRELSLSFSNEEIEYDSLRERIRSIADEGRNAFVDVTAIDKRYIGDLVVAALVEGLAGLHIFALTDRPDFEAPWKMLIHELEDSNGKYNYINIVNTPVYRSGARTVVVRAPRLGIAIAATVLLLLCTGVAYWWLGG